ncbi:S8 family serine peptidase [Kytococcus sedentarius]|uniref:S8 family serine peptidase n=1 Tax=Kytococcus sedentarius TaxID=1276 RepID=UPI0009E638E4|nr:S8 family serine peptidase [Kytococcus sedentarius]
MRRTAARIGIIAALALSMGVATATAPPAHADTPAPLVSAPRANDDEMNYAINLAGAASAEEFERALALVPSVGGAALASYPEIGTFFAQSATPSFASDLAAALKKAGVGVHSIGPTRVAPVLYYERVQLPTPAGAQLPAQGTEPATASGATVAQTSGATVAQTSGVTPAGGLSAVGEETVTEADSGTGEAIFNWGATEMKAAEAAAVDVRRAPVSVAVVDSGVEDTHPDLEGRVDTARSVKCSVNGVATQEMNGWRDEFYHGTHVAGIIAANHNGVGIDGIAPNASIVAIQATNDNRLIYPEYVACAFMWAASHGVDVVNNSYSMDPWVYWSPTDPEQAAGLEGATRAIRYAQGKGLAVIAAAGNEGVDIDNPSIDNASPTDVPAPTKNRPVAGSIRVPSMLDGVAQVSAVKQAYGVVPGRVSLMRADFSNYGTTIDFAAPGDQIYSTAPLLFYRSGYAVADGTSMATPHVSGVAALIKSIHPEYTGAQVIDLMRKQAAANYGLLNAPTDSHEYRGAGLPIALDAVLKDQPKPVIGPLEYSSDGRTWHSLDGATLAGTVSVRATVSGPVTAARMVAGERELASTQGDGAASDTSVTLQADGVDAASLRSPLEEGPLTVRVEASGRNNDPRADDDAFAQVSFAVASDEARAGRWVSDALGWWWRFEDGTYPVSTVRRIDGQLYRFDARGYMVTGWVKDGGSWYYHGLGGAQATGWVRDGRSWYYLDDSGAMATGWVHDGGRWYHLASFGAMDTGWLRVGSSWYYLDDSGAMATGWLPYAGSWYYLEDSGVMVTGTRVIEGREYSFDATGRLR